MVSVPASVLHRVLGEPVSELYDIGYRRLRWRCGCNAKGMTSQQMLVERCLLHRHLSLTADGPTTRLFKRSR